VFTVSDGDGGLSAESAKTVNVNWPPESWVHDSSRGLTTPQSTSRWTAGSNDPKLRRMRPADVRKIRPKCTFLAGRRRP